MKFFSVIFIFFGSAFLLSAQHTLTVEVKNLRNASGCLYISLYNSEDGFPNNSDKSMKKGKMTGISKESVTYAFKDLAPGTYAVSVFHDEDCNGEMKTNVLGIPQEGTGASNNAKGKFGPPKYIDAKFVISDDKRISISMHYF